MVGQMIVGQMMVGQMMVGQMIVRHNRVYDTKYVIIRYLLYIEKILC